MMMEYDTYICYERGKVKQELDDWWPVDIIEEASRMC